MKRGKTMANESYLQMTNWESNNNIMRESCSVNNSLPESCSNNDIIRDSCNINNSLAENCSNNDSLGESCYDNLTTNCNDSMRKCISNKDSLGKICRSNDSLGESCKNNNSCPQLFDINSNDKYTAAIELSNKCREFYQSRLQTASSMKSRWCNGSSVRQHDHVTCNNASLSSSSSSTSLSSDAENTASGNRRQRHRIDEAMEKLRAEMVSLMDQDLSLMKQLLTLNETIEDLKWQRQYYSYSTSWASSTASKYTNSNLSISDTQMYDSEDDIMAAKQKSSGSLHSAPPIKSGWYTSVIKNTAEVGTTPVDSMKISPLVDTGITSVGSRTSFQTTYTVDSRSGSQASEIVSIHHDRSEHSFDSGIHESGDELAWSV